MRKFQIVISLNVLEEFCEGLEIQNVSEKVDCKVCVNEILYRDQNFNENQNRGNLCCFMIKNLFLFYWCFEIYFKYDMLDIFLESLIVY